MADHYFTNNPQVESKPQRWEFTLRNHHLVFESDNGVFSKKEVDFGSRVLIESFILPKVTGDILDLGCGYGPIGLSLAKDFPDRHIEMVDINERAVELAKKNSELNQIKNITIFPSNLFDKLQNKKFASILTNPPIRAGKQTVHAIFEQSIEHLHPKGELWVVIQKKQGAPSAIEKLQAIFDEVEIMNKKKGYFIIKATK